MTAHGPFHSLSDSDMQALTDKLRSGASVLHAASALGLNYAHTLGFGHQRRTDQQALARAVTMVAAGALVRPGFNGG